MLHTGDSQLRAELLGRIHGSRADQHGPMRAKHLLRRLHHEFELRFFRGEDPVRQHFALGRLVRRHLARPAAIHLAKLPEVGQQRAAHPRELRVEPVEILEGDLRRVVAGHVDLHVLLRLDGLVQPIAPMAIRHRPARAFIDDDDLVFLVHHVVLIAHEAVVGVECFLDRFEEFIHGLGVLAGGRVGIADEVPAVVGDLDLVLLQVHGEVGVALHFACDLIGPGEHDLLVGFGGPRGVGDDQRRLRFIDEDAVGFIHDGVVQDALHAGVHAGGRGPGDERCPERGGIRLPAAELEPIAQEVEPELGSRAVGHVRLIRHGTRSFFHLLLEYADREPELLVHGPDPLGVALGQVIVHGGDVDALAD